MTPVFGLSSVLGFPYWLDPLRFEPYDPVAEGRFELPQVLTYRMQIGVELSRVLDAMLSRHIDDRIFHALSPNIHTILALYILRPHLVRTYPYVHARPVSG